MACGCGHLSEAESREESQEKSESSGESTAWRGCKVLAEKANLEIMSKGNCLWFDPTVFRETGLGVRALQSHRIAPKKWRICIIEFSS